MSRQPILLTGFGPFPGAPENVSKWLVEALADTIPPSRLGCGLHGAVLPTEWVEVSRRGPDLLDRHKPRLVLHFGLNRRARGFRIEQFAHNRIEVRPDARGALPKSGCILERGRARLDTPSSRKEACPTPATEWTSGGNVSFRGRLPLQLSLLSLAPLGSGASGALPCLLCASPARTEGGWSLD